MMSAPAISKTYIELPVDLKRKFKAAASLRGLQFREAIIELMEKYLSTGVGNSPTQHHNDSVTESVSAPPSENQARVLALIKEATALLESDQKAVGVAPSGGRKPVSRKAG